MIVQRNSSKSPKICQIVPANAKNRVQRLLKIRYTLLSLFIFTLPVHTYCILKVVALIPNYSSSLPIYPTKINNASSYYPTSIPWIDNSLSCEKSGRVWNNDQCWDAEHSALF